MWTPNERDKRILAELHPDLREAIRQVLSHTNVPGKLPAGVFLRPHTGYRPPEEQLAAYRAGHSKLKRGTYM